MGIYGFCMQPSIGMFLLKIKKDSGTNKKQNYIYWKIFIVMPDKL